jgi:hypothetical protein
MSYHFGFWILDWETGAISGFRKAICHIHYSNWYQESFRLEQIPIQSLDSADCYVELLYTHNFTI